MDSSPIRPTIVMSAALVFALLFVGAPAAQAGHDLGQDCYTCHNIQSGQVWAGSYSIYSGQPIGMSPYSRPITCDVCHTDFGNRFRATSESHHPVAVIADNTMSSDYDNGVVLRCKDCHNADSVTLSPNLHPDLAPTHYNGVAGNDNVDGYPNHDVASANNQVNPGDPPHLLSMLLSGGQRTVSGAATYNRLPSSAPATDYAFCLSCHDGSGNTARAVNVRQDYIDKGHYFKVTNAGQGITAGDRMPCSDCHASHNSGTNARLFEPDNVTFAGTRPTNLRFASPYAPSNAEYRAMCNFCHDDYNASNTGNGTPTVRTVEPSPRRYGVSGHAPTDTQSCKQCHNPHKTPGGGPDCLTCHTAGGAAGSRYDYIDALFKGVGSDNGVSRPSDAAPLSWSQHGGFNGTTPYFIYQSPYNTKVSNDCFKCHGDRHNNTYRLIDADPGDTYVFNNAVTSLRAATVENANAFCLTCHDGNGSDADIRVGGTSAPYPPNVATTWATRGHGLTSGAYGVSGNSAANIKCIDCHEIHGSNHARLLPADNTATGSFAMPAGKPGMTFRSGAGTLQASAIDFTNHSLPSSGDTFGTTGNPGGLTSAPQGYTGTATTGLCDACHRYPGTPPAGTTSTYNKAHTHEGIAGQGKPASQMTFTKDCVECHNPHGGANGNVYMVSDNIVVTQAAGAGTYPVTFRDNTMFDPVEAGQGNSLCNVCHVSPSQDAALNVSHNYRITTDDPDHAEGSNCTGCHPHGKTDNTAQFGFPQAGCNSCHGPASDSAGMPSATDGATYDTDANNIIGTRGGTDNTAHYIHVNYLVNRRGISRANSCYVCHLGGGSQESGGHPGNPTNKTYRSLPTPTAVPYLQVALDNTGAVLNVWNGAGTGPTYAGTPGQAADGTNGWKTCSNTTCHYALSPSWSGKRQFAAPPGTMTVSTPDALPAAGSLNAGSVNNVVDKLRLQTDASGVVTDNQFKIRLAAGSTAQNADIAKVAFWEDVNNDNTVSAGDIQIGGNAAFSPADNGYTVAPVNYSVPASTTKNILVAVDIASGAANGRTMTFSTVNGDITASYGTIAGWTTFDSSQFTISAPGTLTVSTPDALPASGPVMIGAGNNVMDKINLAATGGYATVTGLRVRELGTAADGTDIASVSFWHDVNANGVLDPGTDTILGGAATFNAADNTYSVSGLSLNVPSGTTENILVVDNVAAGATVSRTIQTQVIDNTYVTLSAGTVAGAFPIAASGTQTISSGGQLTVTTPDALPAAGDIRGASDNNAIDSITLSAASANVMVSGLWVKELGTALDTSDIASVSFVDNTGGANTPLGTATFNAVDNTYRLTGLSLTVTVATPRTIRVMASIANGATAARTVQTQVNDGYVQVSAGTVNTITPFSSTVQTIRALTGVIVTDTPGSSTPVDTTSLGQGGTHQFYATATYSNAALNQDVTASSGWSRAGTATGSTIGASTGLYTAGTTDGTDTVTATFRGQSDTTSVTVTSTQPMGPFTYLAQADASGTALATGITTNFSGTAQTPPRWTTAVETGQVVTGTYVQTTSTSEIVAFTAVYNTVVASGTVITDLQMQGRVRSYSAGSRFRLELIALAANGTVSSLYLSSQLTAPNNAGTTSNVGVGPLSGLNISVPAGSKLGIRVYFQHSSGTATRAYTTDGTGGTATSTWFSISGTILAPTLTGLVITDTQGSTTPVDTTVLATGGATHQFYATAMYSDSSTVDVTGPSLSVWSRSGTATGSTIGAGTGLYTSGTTAGTDTVTTSYSGRSDNTSVTVMPTFPSTAYIVTINSGTALGWGNTNMTSGTAKTTQNDNTLLLKSGESTTATYYGATVTTLRNAYNAIWNTALAAGSNTRITGVTFNIYTRKGNTADRIQLILMYFNPSNGAATTIYDTGLVDPGGNTFSNTLYTHNSPALSVSVPDGMKLGLKVNFQQGSGTAMRVYVATGAPGQNTQFTLSGTSSSGVAPAPPRQTGDTTAIACNTCHQFAPDDATAGYKDSNQYYYAQPGSHAAHGVTLFAGTDPVADNALNACTVCHLATTNTFGADHMSGAVDLRSGTIGTRASGPAFADDGTYDNGTRTCSSVYCHAGRPTPQGGVPLRSWGYGSSTCGVCHAVTPPFGKHAIHNNGNVNTTPSNGSTAANYNYSCYYCHPSGTAHVNYPVSAVQAAQVAFAGTLGAQALGGSYTPGGTSAGWDNVTNQGLSWTNGSCATYCHTNGQGGPALVNPTWNHAGFPTAACTGCHDDAGAATGLSAPHLKHTDNTAVATTYKFTCDECHAATVADNQRTVLHATTGRPNHVDGNLTVQFGTTLRTTSLAIGGTYTQGVDNCANTYCHSDGSSIKNGGAIQANSATWTAGPLACNSCHGAGGPATGAPNYTTSGTRRNSHPAHAAFGCQVCHAQTTTTGNTITGADNHVNGSYQVSGTGFTYDGTNMQTTGSTCAFTGGCHGTSTVTWGVPLSNGCFACHTGSEVANKPLEASDMTGNPVDGAQYDTSGHGNSTTYSWDGIAGANFLYGNSGTPNSGCYECHSIAAAHMPKNAGDPYRLGTDNQSVDNLCNRCHAAGATDPHRAQNSLNLSIAGHNRTTTASARTWPGNYDYKCVDCHDPHGDGNFYMVRSAVNNPTSSTDASAGSNAFGTPKDSTLSPIAFTSTAGFAANSYAQPGGGTWGICEVCHNQTTPYSRTQDNVGTHAQNTGRCTNCHDHDKGFRGVCTDCHGNPGATTNWPDNTATGASYPNRAGKHAKHVTAIGTGNASCGACHPGNPPATHPDGSVAPARLINMDLDGNGTVDADAGSYRNMAGSAVDSDGRYNAVLTTCSNIDCHGGNATPTWYPDNRAPAWSPNSGIVVTDNQSGGALNVMWRPAADATGPVLYDVYQSTVQATLFTAPQTVYTNLVDNSLLATGLTNGTTYYFGVRARDSAVPQNATVNVDNASGVPSGGGGGTSVVYYLNKPAANTLLWGAISTNLSPTCGTATTGLAVSTAPGGTTWPGTLPDPSNPPAGRGLLTTARTCTTASTSNYMASNTTAWNTNWRLFGGFYTAPYANATIVTGSATGNSFGFQSSSGTEDVRILFAAVDASGNHTVNTAQYVEQLNVPTTMTSYATLNLGTLSVAVPAGGRFAILFYYYDTSTTGSSNHRIAYDYYSTTITNQINVTERVVDATAPTWSGGASGIAVADQATGGSLNVSWNTATDTGIPNTPPVRYDLYRSATLADLWTAVYRANLGVTTVQDTGLVNGTRYYYGVRAKDSASPPNATDNTQYASGVPTAPGGCTTCHGVPSNTGAHFKHATPDNVYTDCDNCHGNATYSVSPARGGGYTTGGPAGLHNNGTVEVYMRANGETNAAWNDVAAPNDTCSNVDCHFNTTTPSWTTGTTNCTSCHQYPPTTQAGLVDHDANLTQTTLAGFLSSHDDCLICHGIKSSTSDGLGARVIHANYPAGSHGDGLIRMNGPDATPGPAAGAQYDDVNGGCAKACHPNDATYQMGTSATRDVNYADFGANECTVCHKVGGTGAVVTAASPHTKIKRADGTGAACTACHPGNLRGGFHKKNADANVVAVPNYATVGINYAHTVDTGVTGYVLGGDNTAGTTEAEICWNCHDENNNGVLDGTEPSEWGTNTNTNGTANNYNFGTLNQKAWLGATWTSAQAASPSFAYKTGVINPDTLANQYRGSIHTGNPSSLGGPTVNYGKTTAQIRCSYCHDVHDTKAGSPNGKPFLRGTWKGSPYKEDGAPQNGTAYTNISPWGTVPRGTPAQTVMGGYWIDQNSGNPAGTWTANDSAGLCELCHGNGDGNFTSAEIDALNVFDAQGVGWVSGLNGHRNAVLGASLNDTAAARNIFAGRGGATNQTQQNTADHPYMLFDGTSTPGDSNGGFRGGDSQWRYTPAMIAQPMDGPDWVATLWGTDATPSRALDLRGTTVNAGYHQFPCSKCHNPHASRLPRLMITNCLDTKHNTWDNAYQVHGTTDTINAGRSISNWSSAQNCHRLRGDDPSDTRDTAAPDLPGNRGWNTVTPW